MQNAIALVSLCALPTLPSLLHGVVSWVWQSAANETDHPVSAAGRAQQAQGMGCVLILLRRRRFVGGDDSTPRPSDHPMAAMVRGRWR